ncbi:MAG: thiamine pyrophosphate-binding protein, partial [Nocardioidaceae bacterium]
ETAPATDAPPPPPAPSPYAPAADDVRRLADALRDAERPVFIAGRGARTDDARSALTRLADRCGALLATSAVAKGLFRDDPWSLDVSGGFASPLAAELIGDSDLVVGFGCTLNMWTTRHGRLIADDAVVVQVDDDPGRLGLHRDVALGVLGDVAATAAATADLLADASPVGHRTESVRAALAERGHWSRTPFDDSSTAQRIDPQLLTRTLDEMLPDERAVAIDSGNFMGYPSMFLRVPDERGFCFTQAFQSIGLGLATAIGTALAQPDRLPVAALGDGGALMAAAELETVVRLGLPMVVIVYNDAAYGAEVHHFASSGQSLDTVTFPDTDFAAIARGYGYDVVTVRRFGDLDRVAGWIAGPRTSPLLIDAKVLTDEPSWWLEEAFRGH